MVVPLLLSDPSTVLRYGDLGRTVLHCLHVVHSMERALSIFLEVLNYGDQGHTAPPLHSLSAFDAHVGDCACQTRAQMFWDLVAVYQRQDNKRALVDAILNLNVIKTNTAQLLEEIELSHGKPRNPNLMVLVNHLAVWERIGFKKFLDISVNAPAEDSSASEDTSESQALKLPAQRSGHRRRDIAVDTDWNPHNVVSVARLLTMCNLLSEFRFANIEAGPPTRVKVRVDLQLMYERNAKELDGLKLTKRALNYHIKAHEKMNRQTEAMQIYVARATASWVQQMAMKDRDIWSCFPQEFVATSHRKIMCISSYASFLLVRDAWIKFNIPILLMIQHFCSHGGYRNVYCRIVPNPMADISKDEYAAIGEDHWFDTEVLTLDQVAAASWARIPHTIIVGMSCPGTIEDFKLRLLDSQQGLLPVQHRCGQADECALTIERTNISQLIAHFFAQHEQFPFTLSGEDEFERVGNALHRSLGRDAEAAFNEARDGADKFGTGRSTRLATLEHIFLEYPSVLARNLKGIGEKPQVLGCQLE